MTPPASPGREDRIARSLRVWRIIGSPAFPQREEELISFVTRNVEYAPYDPAGIARQTAAVFAAPPRNDRLKTLKVPALVIHGADDPLIPPSGGEDTANSIPGAERLIVPGAGHDFTGGARAGLCPGDRRIRRQGRACNGSVHREAGA